MLLDVLAHIIRVQKCRQSSGRSASQQNLRRLVHVVRCLDEGVQHEIQVATAAEVQGHVLALVLGVGPGNRVAAVARKRGSVTVEEDDVIVAGHRAHSIAVVQQPRKAKFFGEILGRAQLRVGAASTRIFVVAPAPALEVEHPAILAIAGGVSAFEIDARWGAVQAERAALSRFCRVQNVQRHQIAGQHQRTHSQKADKEHHRQTGAERKLKRGVLDLAMLSRLELLPLELHLELLEHLRGPGLVALRRVCRTLQRAVDAQLQKGAVLLSQHGNAQALHSLLRKLHPGPRCVYLATMNDETLLEALEGVEPLEHTRRLTLGGCTLAHEPALRLLVRVFPQVVELGLSCSAIKPDGLKQLQQAYGGCWTHLGVVVDQERPRVVNSLLPHPPPSLAVSTLVSLKIDHNARVTPASKLKDLHLRCPNLQQLTVAIVDLPGFKHMLKCSGLRNLKFQIYAGPRCDAANLAAVLAASPSAATLQHLEMCSHQNQLSASGAAYLVQLGQLRSLSLPGVDVLPAAQAVLLAQCPLLADLMFTACHLCVQPRFAPALQRLKVQGAFLLGLDQEAVDAFLTAAGVSQLRSLSLCYMHLEGAALERWVALLPAGAELCLTHTRLSLAGLLQALRSRQHPLSKLSVAGNNLEPGEVRQLRALVPCVIADADLVAEMHRRLNWACV
eukprot:m.76718 g.76718  ORF g.76718 m.76718 type:complete len:674 (+) comp17245_c0_seq1:634-2655(+)